MNKYFISAQELLLDSFKLAQQIRLSGFKPNFIIGVWRGGTPVGIAIQEYLDYVGIESDHIAIRTSSYHGINQQEKEVRVHGLDYIVDNIDAQDQVLLVDDVFDSGRSMQAIIQELSARARRNMANTVKIACPWFKPEKNKTELVPDFYLHTTNDWLVFPHELSGLTLSEIAAGKPNEISSLLAQVFKDA